ncbi:hypothetical protein PIB30_005276 [Stylosanthes scabra]|uniref:Uncharacterized protein n=1 Tax=Stylosanthes scabra TaxID=79078 RepID=A0ABU6U2T7_9FABA|nr:hypothetical protein [Stylosanthes scabra]
MAMEDRYSRSFGGDKGTPGERCSDTIASICNCGDYAMLFQSKTSFVSVVEKMVLKCVAEKGESCKYFVWLDEYVACFQDNEGGNSRVAADPIERIEEKIASLETLLTAECKKWARNAGGNKIRGTVLFMLGIVVAYCWIEMFSSFK